LLIGLILCLISDKQEVMRRVGKQEDGFSILYEGSDVPLGEFYEQGCLPWRDWLYAPESSLHE
jgi:hypothetical protein